MCRIIGFVAVTIFFNFSAWLVMSYLYLNKYYTPSAFHLTAFIPNIKCDCQRKVATHERLYWTRRKQLAEILRLKYSLDSIANYMYNMNQNNVICLAWFVVRYRVFWIIPYMADYVTYKLSGYVMLSQFYTVRQIWIYRCTHLKFCFYTRA